MPDRRGLLCFGGFARHDWALLWQRQQAVLTRLAGRFEIHYVERFSTRRLTAGELLAAAFRRLAARSPSGAATAGSNFSFINPHVAPFHGSNFWRRRNLAALERSIHAAWPTDLPRAILWIYNPSYLALEYLKKTAGQWQRTVYDCVQRFEFNRHYPPDIGQIDREIARRIDVVFADSRAIYEEKRQINPATHFVPQGVDVERFLWTGVNRTPPDDSRWVRRPVLGYHGSWHQAFDEEMVAGCLEALADATFVFIGPTYGRHKGLQRRFRSAIFRGPRDHVRLGRYVNDFNVCLIPYRMDEHTRGVFPTKFFEYVATGLPIVSTDLPDLREYADWVALARNRVEFVEKVKETLRRPRIPPERVRPFVEQHSWDRRLDQILTALALDRA